MTTNTIMTSWITMTTRTNRKDMTMTNTDLVEFKTIYPDIERYLAEDCYVPNEVRDSRTGISCMQVPANTMVVEIVKTVKMAAVIVPDSKIVVFMWYGNDDGDNPDMHVLNMQYFDATDNNIEFAKKYARGTAVRGVDHIDAFDPLGDARQFAQLMSLCNGLVILSPERLSPMTYYNLRHTHHKRESWIKRLLSLTRHGWLSAWARKRP